MANRRWWTCPWPGNPETCGHAGGTAAGAALVGSYGALWRLASLVPVWTPLRCHLQRVDRENTAADIEVTHQRPQAHLDWHGVGRDHGPIDREDDLRGLPIDTVPMRGVKPSARNHRIER